MTPAPKWLTERLETMLPELATLGKETPDNRAAVKAWFERLIGHFNERGPDAPYKQRNLVKDARKAIRERFGDDHLAMSVVAFPPAPKWLTERLETMLPELATLGKETPDNRAAVKAWFERLIGHFNERGLDTPYKQRNRLVDARNAIFDRFDDDHLAMSVVAFDQKTWWEINERHGTAPTDHTADTVESTTMNPSKDQHTIGGLGDLIAAVNAAQAQGRPAQEALMAKYRNTKLSVANADEMLRDKTVPPIFQFSEQGDFQAFPLPDGAYAVVPRFNMPLTPAKSRTVSALFDSPVPDAGDAIQNVCVECPAVMRLNPDNTLTLTGRGELSAVGRETIKVGRSASNDPRTAPNAKNAPGLASGSTAPAGKPDTTAAHLRSKLEHLTAKRDGLKATYRAEQRLHNKHQSRVQEIHAEVSGKPTAAMSDAAKETLDRADVLEGNGKKESAKAAEKPPGLFARLAAKLRALVSKVGGVFRRKSPGEAVNPPAPAVNHDAPQADGGETQETEAAAEAASETEGPAEAVDGPAKEADSPLSAEQKDALKDELQKVMTQIRAIETRLAEIQKQILDLDQQIAEVQKQLQGLEASEAATVKPPVAAAEPKIPAAPTQAKPAAVAPAASASLDALDGAVVLAEGKHHPQATRREAYNVAAAHVADQLRAGETVVLKGDYAKAACLDPESYRVIDRGTELIGDEVVPVFEVHSVLDPRTNAWVESQAQEVAESSEVAPPEVPVEEVPDLASDVKPPKRGGPRR